MKKVLQKQVIKLLSEGGSAADIAEKMGKSKRTVEKWIEVMKYIYGAKNVVHLVVIFLKLKNNESKKTAMRLDNER